MKVADYQKAKPKHTPTLISNDQAFMNYSGYRSDCIATELKFNTIQNTTDKSIHPTVNMISFLLIVSIQMSAMQDRVQSVHC